MIIFKKDDYDKYYPSVSNLKEGYTRDLEEYIKYIFKNYTIVFFDFSFNDNYFKKLLQNNNLWFSVKLSLTIYGISIMVFNFILVTWLGDALYKKTLSL